MDVLERFRARYPFPLDDFQVEAIRAVAGDQSGIGSAPTGAGKTLVAEFAIQAALEAGQRIAYTTPLKALSNQKFGDFTRAYGEDKVGILTGDVKVNPHAPVLVMTTEILRNALYGSGFPGLGYIVLDECHYMGDEGRGTVWEEIIVSAPRGLRAGDGGRAHRGQAAHHPRAAARGGRVHRERGGRPAGARRIRPEPVGVPRPAPGRGPASRRHPARPQAPDRDALRAWPLQGGLRHGDDVARHPHAGARGGAAEPHQ